MNIVLWVVQILLAVGFVAIGSMKIVMSGDKIRTNYGTAPWLIRLLGTAEVLGAIGLILPGLTGIAPFLTPLAATGLAIVMVGALAVHVRRKEFASLAVPAVFLILTIVVACARFGPFAF
ncbi:DoxX family protein [Plantibacter sp. YIM 135347]|uniref:DoxX family protein n=1 Tax=Plantibacter sp. YIM 135347 TaxID=3423919 RepID=UPI003D357842